MEGRRRKTALFLFLRAIKHTRRVVELRTFQEMRRFSFREFFKSMKIATALSAMFLSAFFGLRADAGAPQIDAITNPPPKPNPSRLLNISARANIGTDDRVAIAGFITE